LPRLAWALRTRPRSFPVKIEDVIPKRRVFTSDARDLARSWSAAGTLHARSFAPPGMRLRSGWQRGWRRVAVRVEREPHARTGRVRLQSHRTALIGWSALAAETVLARSTILAPSGLSRDLFCLQLAPYGRCALSGQAQLL